MSKLDDSLKRLGEQLAKLTDLNATPALLAGAYTLQKYSMENTPVKTGFLRASHESVVVDDHAEMHVNTDYAYYVEMGTEKWSGKPFIRPAIDEHEDDVVKAVAKQIQKDIKDSL